MSIRRIAAFLIAASGAITAAGCGSPPTNTVAITYYRPTSAAMAALGTDKYGIPFPAIRWGNPNQLILTTWGSESCPELPSAVTIQSPHRITIDLGSGPGAGNTGCTADRTPTDSIVGAPAGLDSNTPSIAEIQGHDVALAVRNG